jgi:hypothetical protein
MCQIILRYVHAALLVYYVEVKAKCGELIRKVEINEQIMVEDGQGE